MPFPPNFEDYHWIYKKFPWLIDVTFWGFIVPVQLLTYAVDYVFGTRFMTNKKCGKCGREYPGAWHYCPGCGKKNERRFRQDLNNFKEVDENE